jgi:hypothetical protein
MSARTARGNRIGLALVGLALVGPAAYTLLRGTGQLAGLPADGPVVPAPLRELASTEQWFWPAVAVGVGLVTLLALRWLLVQARSDKLDKLVLDEAQHGATYLDARALGSATADQVAALPSVRRARATLVDISNAAQLRLTLVVDQDLDMDELRSGVLAALHDSRRLLQHENLHAVVHLRVRRRRHATRVT